MATLFSKDKQKVLEFILENPNYEIKVRELAKKLGLSPAHVSRTVKELEKQKIITAGKADIFNPVARALKIFFNTQKIKSQGIDKMLGKLKPAGGGLYGSWAKGTNDEESDVDIWVTPGRHAGEKEIASVESEIRKAIGKQVHLLALTPERIKRLKKEDPVFYYSLVFGSITILGEPLD